MLRRAGIPKRCCAPDRKLRTVFGEDADAAPLVQWMDDKARFRTDDEPAVVRIEGGGMRGMDLGYAVARVCVVRGIAATCLPLCDLRDIVNDRTDDALDLSNYRVLVVQGADDGKDPVPGAPPPDDWALDWMLVEWLNACRHLVLVSENDITAALWSKRLRGLLLQHTAVQIRLKAELYPSQAKRK